MYDNIFNHNLFGGNVGDMMDLETFYNVVYNAINKHPSYVILSDIEKERKVKILENLIKFYENKELYERCSRLQDIKRAVS